MSFGLLLWNLAGGTLHFRCAAGILIFYYVIRWLGHNCSHMHDIARSHLLAAGTDFDPSLYSLFRRQVSLIVSFSLMLTCCRFLRMTSCMLYIFKQILRLST